MSHYHWHRGHRVAGKLFRDIVETVDLATYFDSGTTQSAEHLSKWYEDEIIPHRHYRDFVKKSHGAAMARKLAKHYASLSRFTHRSYGALMDGYSLGQDDRLVHDAAVLSFCGDEDSKTFLVLPETLASYYAVLANLILMYSEELRARGLATERDISKAFADCLEPDTVPRRFLPAKWLAERIRHAKSDAQSETTGE